MTKCRECGREISDRAPTCPGCGAPTPKRTTLGTWVAGGLFTVFVASCVGVKVASHDAAAPAPIAKTAEQLAAEAKSEREFQHVVQVLTAIKASLKNPATCDVSKAGLVPSGAVCVEYRAANSFNAIVLERAAIDANGKSGDWTRLCAGKSGDEYTSARRALALT